MAATRLEGYAIAPTQFTLHLLLHSGGFSQLQVSCFALLWIAMLPWSVQEASEGFKCCFALPCCALFFLLSVSLLCSALLCSALLCALCSVLCCAVMCCAVLCCTVLCCAVLSCTVLCFAVVCCAVLRSAVLCCAVLWGSLSYTVWSLALG